MKDYTNVKLAREWIDETAEMLQGRGKKPELEITSIKCLNSLTWGIHKKEMTVIGARPANGKSVLAIQLAWDLAKQGHLVYFASLEMTVPRILERIFCLEYSIDNYDLMRGGINNVEIIKTKWNEFIKQVSNTKLMLSDMIGRDWVDIKKVDEFMARPPDAVFIDHIQEISGGQNKLLAMEAYLDNFRELAIRRNFALVICSQVNRLSQNENDKTPQLHHLKNTGALEEKADNVWLLHYEFLYGRDESKKNKLKIMIAKSRYSATGHIEVYFKPEHSRISDKEIHAENKSQRVISPRGCKDDTDDNGDVQRGDSQNNGQEISASDIQWQE